jgi:thioredoxin 2
MHSAAPQPDTAPQPIVVACPHCHTLVRVPEARLGDNPTCGKCKSAVVTGHPVALSADSFQTHIGRSDLPVLVDFWAEWCGPCRAMSPVLDRFASERRTQLQVGKVNTDENQQLAGQLGIRSIPTLILFRGGKEVARRSGSSDLGSLSRWVDSALAQ